MGGDDPVDVYASEEDYGSNYKSNVNLPAIPEKGDPS